MYIYIYDYIIYLTTRFVPSDHRRISRFAHRVGKPVSATLARPDNMKDLEPVGARWIWDSYVLA